MESRSATATQKMTALAQHQIDLDFRIKYARAIWHKWRRSEITQRREIPQTKAWLGICIKLRRQREQVKAIFAPYPWEEQGITRDQWAKAKKRSRNV